MDKAAAQVKFRTTAALYTAVSRIAYRAPGCKKRAGLDEL